MANPPLDSERVKCAAEPVEHVPSLDQLRWMLQTEGLATAARDEASAGSSAGAAGRRLRRAVSPIRLCGGVALLTVAAAGLAMLHASDPAASAARAVTALAVPGLPVTPMLPPAARPTPTMAAEANPSAAPLAPEPVNFAVPREAAAASPSAEGAMTLAPWAVRSALSILAPYPAEPRASPIPEATPDRTADAEVARPPEVMPDSATPPPPRVRRKAAELAPKVRRSGPRVAFRRLPSHAHHLWRAASWQYPPYPSGTSYYFVRGSARAY